MVGGRVGYLAWQEFCRVWLELVCHECLGQSDIWVSFDGKLGCLFGGHLLCVCLAFCNSKYGLVSHVGLLKDIGGFCTFS